MKSKCTICLDDIHEKMYIHDMCDCRNICYHANCFKKWMYAKKDTLICEICNAPYTNVSRKYITIKSPMYDSMNWICIRYGKYTEVR